ncbi:MAG: biopolymer transporter ExbD [Chlamydiia bacterium]|nr:biopolymer transporter ExbD [Chlamydiia bacterium]
MLQVKTSLPKLPSGIGSAPYLTICVLLLSIFILSSSLLSVKSLPITLTEVIDDVGDLSAISSPVVIAIDGYQTIYYGPQRELVDLNTLDRMLEEEVKRHNRRFENTSPVVLLHVDRQTPYGTFLQLLYRIQRISSDVRLTYSNGE